MNERITFVSMFDNNNLAKIENYTKMIDDKLCKVPFGKNVDNREEADTLPYHFTLSAWDILHEEKVINELSKIEYPKLKILINNIGIMNGKEIYNWLEHHCNEEVTLNKMLAPEIEARYKLTNKLLNKYGIKQVLELAAGYSSRGLFYSKKGYNYVELDLENVTKNKKEILHSIEKDIPENLNIISGNALKKDDFKKIESYFITDKPIAVINEGLMRYLTFDEKKLVAQNIYDLLSKYGGIWITCDVTPKKFMKSQDKALPDFNKNLSNITSRNNLNDRFEDENHIRRFFGEVGFELVEIHKFNEMKDELYSINELGIIDDKIEKTLEDAIVVIMKIKK